jgi:hypothetical protein
MGIFLFIAMFGYSFFVGVTTKNNHFKHLLTSVLFMLYLLYVSYTYLPFLIYAVYIIGVILFVFSIRKTVITELVNQIPVLLLLFYKIYQFYYTDLSVQYQSPLEYFLTTMFFLVGLSFMLSLLSKKSILMPYFIATIYCLVADNHLAEILIFSIIGYYFSTKTRMDGFLPISLLSFFLVIVSNLGMLFLLACLTIILVARWTKKEYVIPTLEIIGIFLFVGLIGYFVNKELIFIPTQKILINSIILIFSMILSVINIIWLIKFGVEDKKQHLSIIFASIIMCGVCLFYSVCHFDIVLILLNILIVLKNIDFIKIKP